MRFRKKFIFFDKVFFINKIKLLIKLIINKFSVDIVRFQSIEQDLKIIFKKKIDKKIIIFDVGAFTGNSVFEFRKVFKNSLIFSFEPSKKNFDILKKNTKNIKNLRLHNIALSNKNGYSNFYENKWEYTSSLLPLNNSEYKKRLEKIFKYRGINEIQSKYLVKTHTLDNFIKNKNISHIDILKIDTQGNEIDVLKGMSYLLKHKIAKVIIIELIFENYYRNSKTSFYNVEKYLHKNNYKMMGIYNINKTAGNFLSQIDVMYTFNN